MVKLDGYMAGANLGHWISQYGSQGKEHWDTYVQASDIARMKAWGLDHVRVPVDYFLFESDEQPGVYREEGLAYIDNVLSWCKQEGLNMVLDLHCAPGFFFADLDKNDLFSSQASQKRFTDIWRFFAERYNGEGDNLLFELINEIAFVPPVPEGLTWNDIAAEASAPWNELWQKVVAEILLISPHRRIVVGSNCGYNLHELKHLKVDPSDNVIYSFHFYDPPLFTHQRAGWWPEMRDYPKTVLFPFNPKEHAARWNGQVAPEYADFDEVGKEYLLKDLAPAFEFIEQTGKPLYCGEYGVINHADDASAVRWLNMTSEILAEHGIGRAVWSYRGFSCITASDNKSWNEDMVKAISKMA